MYYDAVEAGLRKVRIRPKFLARAPARVQNQSPFLVRKARRGKRLTVESEPAKKP